MAGLAVAALILLLPAPAHGQDSALNTFSPYTLYGVGDLAPDGLVQTRSMGSIGVAYKSSIAVNSLNPASLGIIAQKAFLFDVALDGSNFYLRSTGSNGVPRRTSYNSFNLSNISLAIPFARGVGFSLNMSPYSTVGYRVESEETDPTILANVGQVLYTHIGQGGINQFKANLGVQLSKRLSLGASLVYYRGRIDRMYYITVTSVMSDDTYNSVNAVDYSQISKPYGQFGVQWNAIATNDRILSLGATYQTGGRLGMNNTRYIPSSNMSKDTVRNDIMQIPFKMPSTMRLGAFYGTQRWVLSADYIFQNWGVNTWSESPIIKYVNTSGIRFGAELTPNRGDFRHALNRWSYRAGLRYDQYYMEVLGRRIADAAVSVGLGIPVNAAGTTSLNLGLEAGRQGRPDNGLIQSNYFKIFLGFSFFGVDFWFVQPKYD